MEKKDQRLLHLVIGWMVYAPVLYLIMPDLWTFDLTPQLWILAFVSLGIVPYIVYKAYVVKNWEAFPIGLSTYSFLWMITGIIIGFLLGESTKWVGEQLFR